MPDSMASSNIVYIIGLLYSIILIGIVMYIINKTTEQSRYCEKLNDINPSAPPPLYNLSSLVSRESLESDIPGSLNLKLDENNELILPGYTIKSYKFPDAPTSSPEILDGVGNEKFIKTGNFEMNIKKDGEDKVVTIPMKCNSGAFTVDNERYSIAPARHGTVVPNSESPSLSANVLANDPTMSQVAGSDAIILNKEREKGCLINTSLRLNYAHFQEKIVDDSGLATTQKYGMNCLLNVHIKTAINCCAINANTNSFVNLCALNYCIDYGVRCLDFEIYSVDDMPVIGLSSKEGNANMKESYNKILLINALNMINRRAFLTDRPEPLIIHLRLKSNLISTLLDIQDVLANCELTHRMAFGHKQKGLFWGYSAFEENIREQKIPTHEILKANLGEFGHYNVIIALDLSETKWATFAENSTLTTKIFKENGLTKLGHMVNLISPSKLLKSISITQLAVKSDPELSEIAGNWPAGAVGESMRSLYFVKPDPYAPHSINFVDIAWPVGCQLIAVPMQYTKNLNVKKYNDKFNDGPIIAKDKNLVVRDVKPISLLGV